MLRFNRILKVRLLVSIQDLFSFVVFIFLLSSSPLNALASYNERIIHTQYNNIDPRYSNKQIIFKNIDLVDCEINEGTIHKRYFKLVVYFWITNNIQQHPQALYVVDARTNQQSREQDNVNYVGFDSQNLLYIYRADLELGKDPNRILDLYGKMIYNRQLFYTNQGEPNSYFTFHYKGPTPPPNF